MNDNQYSKFSLLSSEIIQHIENKNANPYIIPTGFENFDKEYGGLNLGELLVVGGRPAMGKTQLVVSMLTNICTTEPVLFFSFDLTSFNLTARFLSNKSGISVGQIINNDLILSDKEVLKNTAHELENMNLFVSEKGVSDLEETIGIIKSHVAEFNTKVVVIDYLQLLGNSKHNNGREAEIGNICRRLKMCAKELNICIVLLSQLSRAVETRGSSKKPQLSDLRDSGSIEQIADKVWLLYRPEYYLIDELDDDEFSSSDCILILIVAKNKNGKIGNSYFKRNIQFTTFQSISKPSDGFTIDVKRLINLENPFQKGNDDTIPF